MKCNFPCVSFRRIPLFNQTIEKYLTNKNQAYMRRFIAIVDVTKIPNDFPIGTNPRCTKLTTRVAREIANSLKNEEYFHILNRGILLSAKTIKHDDINSQITLDFGNEEDDDIYGVVDGGHTYEIIKQYVTTDSPDPDTRYVSLEVFTGIGESDESISITDFAAARNNSVPVDQKSLAELDKKFQFVKDAIKNKPYANNIGYRQNAEADIDIREIVALMTVFDAEKYKPTDIENQPVKAYSQKEDCLKDYLDQYEVEDKRGILSRYKKLSFILPEILELSDYIRNDVPITCSKLGYKISAKITKKISFKERVQQYYFLPNLNVYSKEVYDTRDRNWLWLPILASMRVLVEYSNDNGLAVWKANPIEFYNKNSKLLVSILYQNFKNNPVPNRIGKDKAMWTSLIQAAWMNAVQNKVIEI